MIKNINDALRFNDVEERGGKVIICYDSPTWTFDSFIYL